MFESLQNHIGQIDLRITIPIVVFLALGKWLYKAVPLMLGIYSWKPKDRITNKAIKSIDSYPKDLKLDDGDLCIENSDPAMVSGEKAFKQHLQTFISIKTGSLFYAREYGCEFVDSIFSAKNEEFQRQCEHLARVILEDVGFKEYIEEIYQINRRKAFYLWGERLLIVELKVKGRPDTCRIKLFNLTDKLEKRKAHAKRD